MSENKPSSIFPAFVLGIFIIIVAVAGLYSGSPQSPKMPGVKVLAKPEIQPDAPVGTGAEAKGQSETPPSNDVASEAAPSAPADATAVVAPPTTEVKTEADTNAVAPAVDGKAQ